MAKEKADTEKKKSRKLLQDAQKMFEKREKKEKKKVRPIYLALIPIAGFAVIVMGSIPEIGLALSEETSIEIIVLILMSIFVVLILGGFLIANLSKKKR